MVLVMITFTQPTFTSSGAPPRSTPTLAPSLMQPYTITGLQARTYPGGQIQIRATLDRFPSYTRVYIDYPSDGLTITGVMNIPAGDGPFPVVILLHGYYERSTYWSGQGTWQAAEFFAQHGYLTIAPDFRSWGASDSGINLFATGLVIDTINLISAVSSLPQADASQVVLWGHSMGGGVATKVLTIDSRIRAAVLHAPNSANDADLIARWGPGCLPGQREGDVMCNPAEVIPAPASADLVAAYFQMAHDDQLLQHIAPIYHLESITAPVQIHIGSGDGVTLSQTPPEWSETLYLGLLDAERDAAYFVYPGQGHFFTGQSWTALVERALAFYNLHLGR